MAATGLARGTAAGAVARSTGPGLRPFPIDDHVGAWVPHGRWLRAGQGHGPLHGLRHAVQDLFDIAGQRCAGGVPDRLRRQAPAAHDQALLARLQASGAELAGQLVGDELGLALLGDNPHHGAPQNPRAPDRLTGGACSGAAAAVAAGLLHFALARDSSGDIAVAASHCGLWGLRCSQGLLPSAGILPLSPSFDSVGWLAGEGCVLERVAAAVLPDVTSRAWTAWRPGRLLCPEPVWAWADPVVQAPLQAARQRLAGLLQLPPGSVDGAPAPLAGHPDPAGWGLALDSVSAYEAWHAHGPVDGTSDACAEHLARGRDLGTDALAGARATVQALRDGLRQLLGSDAILLLPAAVGLAPRRDADAGRLHTLRQRGLGLAALAACAGLPQVTLPWPSSADAPLGLSLIGPAGSDRALIRLARQLLPADTRPGWPLR